MGMPPRHNARILTGRLFLWAGIFAAGAGYLLALDMGQPGAVRIALALSLAGCGVVSYAIVQRTLRRAFADQSERLEVANRALSEQLHRFVFLNKLGQDLARNLDLEETMRRLSDRVIDTLDVDELAVLLFDRERRRVYLLTARGFDDNRVVQVPFEAERGITGVAVQSQAAVYVANLTTDHREVAYRSDPNPQGSLFSVPMIYQDQVVGVLNFSSARVDAFSESDQALFETVANQAALALANARLYKETLELTETDGLTGLLNRRGLDKRLALEWARAHRDTMPLSAIMIDIDHFKTYNDQQGHQRGDETLRKVARLLERTVRQVDAVARYGGEEFFVILPRTTTQQALAVAEKLRRTVEAADFERGYLQPLGRVTISCGVATGPNPGISTAADVVEAADRALYSAKHGGRNQVCVSTEAFAESTQSPPSTCSTRSVTSSGSPSPSTRLKRPFSS